MNKKTVLLMQKFICIISIIFCVLFIKYTAAIAVFILPVAIYGILTKNIVISVNYTE